MLRSNGAAGGNRAFADWRMMSWRSVISLPCRLPQVFTIIVMALALLMASTLTATAANISPATLPQPLVGTIYSQQLTASGGVSPYTFSVTSGTTPSGLGVSGNGLVSGTPAVAGAYAFSVTATDVNGLSSSISYSGTVGAPALVITPSGSWNATQGASYSQTLTWSGGTAPYTAIALSGLPTGLTYSTSTTGATISGTPTQTGSFFGAGHCD